MTNEASTIQPSTESTPLPRRQLLRRALLALPIAGAALAANPAHAAEEAAASAAWKMGGNNNIANNNFLGSTNNAPLVIKTNNQERLRVTPTGQIAVGAAPGSTGRLQVTSATDSASVSIYGSSSAYSGRGVQGFADFANNYCYGVYGWSNSTRGRGVAGYVSQTTSNEAVAIFGSASGQGYAGYFAGRVRITTDLSVGGAIINAALRTTIDHPLDPANKTLNHAGVESPDQKLIFDGVATLDGEGTATVQLPAYVAAIGAEFRYQLTPLGAAMPNLHIAQRLQGNHFRLAGGAPGQEVCWQLTAIRNDPYARSQRQAVEREKPAEERGKYLHPAAFDQPAELWVHAAHLQAEHAALTQGSGPLEPEMPVEPAPDNPWPAPTETTDNPLYLPLVGG